MEVFPHVLVRTGGEMFDAVEFVDTSSLNRQLSERQLSLERLTALKTALSDQLLDFNRSVEDRRLQNLVQNFRRDLFNDRTIKQKTVEELARLLPVTLNQEVNVYFSACHIHAKLTSQLHNSCREALIQSRRRLQQLSKSDFLRKGLLLSSLDLLGALGDYSLADPSQFKRRELHVENSLYKYVTRIVTKTSPFSTFSNLVMGAIDPSVLTIDMPFVGGTSGHVQSHVRLNNFLFRYLRMLLIHLPEAFPLLGICANPTIEKAGDHYVFLTNNYNTEVFQRIAIDPISDGILQLVRKDGSMEFRSVVAAVLEWVEADDQSIAEYIKQLIGYGLLEFTISGSGMDPEWDQSFIAYLSATFGEMSGHITQLIRTLRSIRQKAADYECAPVSERRVLLTEAHEQFKSLCIALHEAAGLPFYDYSVRQHAKNTAATPAQAAAVAILQGDEQEADPEEPVADERQPEFQHKHAIPFNFRPENIFFEDTTRAISIRFGKTAIEEVLRKFDRLLQRLRGFDGKTEEKVKMTNFFCEKYGRNANISLLRFYEDYYREVKKPAARQKKESGPPEALRSPEALAWDNAVRSLVKRRQVDPVKGFGFYFDELEEALKDVPLPDMHLPNSIGAWIQFFPEADENGKPVLKGVVNSYFGGYGKMIGRFLHLFDDTVLKDVRSWNGRLASGRILAENCDSTFFNANLHPCLMDHELQAPGSSNHENEASPIKVSEVSVSCDEDTQLLVLKHNSVGKIVHFFDLGFQALKGRTQLYQLLDDFNDSEEHRLFPLLRPLNDLLTKMIYTGKDGAAITLCPRLVLDDLVVLQRKNWLVPPSLLPIRPPQMDDCGYFLLVNEWRRNLGIMDEVFFNIDPFRNAGGKKDDRKPQYIHFLDPVSVLVFEKAISKAKGVSRIAEMLPSSDQLVRINDKRIVTEAVIQWYR
jgi:hypothetical protein